MKQWQAAVSSSNTLTCNDLPSSAFTIFGTFNNSWQIKQLFVHRKESITWEKHSSLNQSYFHPSKLADSTANLNSVWQDSFPFDCYQLYYSHVLCWSSGTDHVIGNNQNYHRNFFPEQVKSREKSTPRGNISKVLSSTSTHHFPPADVRPDHSTLGAQHLYSPSYPQRQDLTWIFAPLYLMTPGTVVSVVNS